MIIAMWGCGGTGKTTIANSLASIYAGKGTAGVIDTDLCRPTLPMQTIGTRLDAEHSLGKYLNRMGTNEIRPYYHQRGDCEGLFHAGLTDRDAYTDYEIGYEAIDRARDFLLQSEELLGTVVVDCSVQRTDPFLPVILRHADHIILPIVPNIGAVYWYGAIRPMLENARALDRLIPIAVMTMPFHLIDEVEKQCGFRFVAQFRYSRELARLGDESRLATEATMKDALHWLRNLHLLYDEIQSRNLQTAADSEDLEVKALE